MDLVQRLFVHMLVTMWLLLVHVKQERLGVGPVCDMGLPRFQHLRVGGLDDWYFSDSYNGRVWIMVSYEFHTFLFNKYFFGVEVVFSS